MDAPHPKDFGVVRGNTQRFKHQLFRLWKCPQCLTIHSVDAVDYQDIYSDYALLKRRLDIFARGTLRNLTRRLSRAGLQKHHAILDFGCGNGIYVRYLRERGYSRVEGFDPYVPEFSTLPGDKGLFDCVVNNDTVEHCDDIRRAIRQSLDLLKTGGIYYLGTADSEPVDMAALEPHVMRLHQPFHRTIVTEKVLHQLAKEFQLDIIAAYRRSYHDTLRPFANYRFLDELSRAVGDDIDRALDPSDVSKVFPKSPRLWFFALFGYFFPTADEPALVLRKRS